MKVLVTGANGFIGRALCAHLGRKGIEIVPVVRRSVDMPNAVILDADDEVNWQAALSGCDAVVHLAGRAAADSSDHNLSDALREANVTSTVCLYQRAAKAKVGRFIFLSTAKVNGEYTKSGDFFSPEDMPAPEDAYASSKWEAECRLQVLAQQLGPELVVIRPPLVYGPGVKGNFSALVQWIQKGIPLPLACVHNKRSMIAVENLSSFIALCADRNCSPKAVNQTFLVSDGAPVSTTELLRKIASAYQTKTRLFCFPTRLLEVFLGFLGMSAQANRLLGSLVLDDAKCYQLLGWVPPLTIEEQLQRMHSAAVS
jgi:nucleoside-diphosphate-sugar epimerase